MHPGKAAPKLECPTLGLPQGRWDLEKSEPRNFSLLIFYRGLHCPLCESYLRSFDDRCEALRELGVEIIALSMDPKYRAERAKSEWRIDRIPIGYNLSEADARRWGLFISESITGKEPKRFNEPGLFLVKRDGTLYYAAITSMPFARPHVADLESAIRFVLKNDYPPRGCVPS